MSQKEATLIPAGKAPAGPWRPTFLERLIRLLPLSYLAGSIFLMTVFGPLGRLFIGYLETGSLTASLEALFLRRMSIPVETRAAAFVVWALAHYYALWMIYQVHHRVVAAEPQIAPLLPQGVETYRAAFGRLSRTGPALLCAAFLGVLSAGQIAEALRGALGTWGLIYRLLYAAWVQLSFGTLAWVYLGAVWGLFELGRASLRLNPLAEEEAMGAKPMGRLSLSVTFAALGMLAFMTLVTLIAPVYIEFLSLLILLTIVGTVMFYLPLQGVHNQMAAAKSALKKTVREQFQRLEEGADHPTTPGDAGRVFHDLRTILLLDARERRISALRTWPVDLGILGKLWAIALTIGISLLTHIIRVSLGL